MYERRMYHRVLTTCWSELLAINSGYLRLLFQLPRFHSIEWDEKVIINFEWTRIWEEVVMTYLMKEGKQIKRTKSKPGVSATLAENRTMYLPNTSLECYCYTNLLLLSYLTREIIKQLHCFTRKFLTITVRGSKCLHIITDE
jgi:hypothetical protein